MGRNVAARGVGVAPRDAAGQGGRALKIIEQSGSLSTSSYLPCRANVAEHSAARCTRAARLASRCMHDATAPVRSRLGHCGRA